METDYVSPGPWVETVEVRIGVDTTNDGKVNHWSDWLTVSEQYDYIDGFSKQIAKTPASLNLSNLPEGYGFQFEFQVDDTVVANVSPIMDRVEMAFVASNFQQWSNDNGVPAEVNGDHNQNGIPNLVEFALGQASTPARQPDGTLTLTATHAALADGYTVQLRFSHDLKTWTTATAETTEVKLLDTTVLGNGDEAMEFDIQSGEEQLFWRIAVF